MSRPRRVRRAPVHAAPWKYGGWQDAPGALPTKPSDPATLAEALAASGYRHYEVAVGDCVHAVWAKNRLAARRVAAKEHKATCLLA